MTDEQKKDDAVTEVEETAVEETAPAAETEAPAEEKKEETTEEAPAAEEAGDEGEDVEVPEKFRTLVEGIESMSVLDLHELVKLLEKKFGVSAAAVAVAAPGVGGADAGGEEKSTFTVKLAAIGDGKVAVIKVVKEVCGLGLKEAKELVESAPVEVKKDLKKEEAEEVKKQLEEAGASVELV